MDALYGFFINKAFDAATTSAGCTWGKQIQLILNFFGKSAVVNNSLECTGALSILTGISAYMIMAVSVAYITKRGIPTKLFWLTVIALALLFVVPIFRGTMQIISEPSKEIIPEDLNIGTIHEPILDKIRRMIHKINSTNYKEKTAK